MRCTILLISRYWEKAVAAAKMTLQPFLAIIYWNSLPPALRENMSMATFKTKLKTYLFPPFTMTLEDHPALLRRFRDFGAVI